jgi:Ca2+-binding EF-hand superfamily protein
MSQTQLASVPPTPQKDPQLVSDDKLKKIKSGTNYLTLAFSIFDQQSNDTVDVREIGTILRFLGICPTLEQLHQWVTEMEEEEPTGYVTWAKFSKVTQSIISGNYPRNADEESLYQAFLALDTDKKGYLLPDELRKYMISLGEPFTVEECDEMLTVF